jgi:arylsulfatase A-like enzyme
MPSESGWGGIPNYQALEGLDLPSAYESLYADEILYTDYWVGRLIEAVDSHHSGREAIVLLTADHGEGLGEMDRWFSHGFSTLPSLVHVPFILRAPGLAPARRDETVSHVDIAPTLLDLAGLPLPEDRSGTALGPVIRGEVAMPDRFVFSDIGSEVTAYHGRTLVRVSGLDDAWNPTGDGALGSSARWLQYFWQSDGSWLPVAEDPSLQSATRAYLNEPTAMKKTPLMELDQLERQRLEALGYTVSH